MFDVGAPLLRALEGARNDLASDAAATARSQTPYGAALSDAGMASVAERAVFTEALLNAMHARLAEIKSVTHG